MSSFFRFCGCLLIWIEFNYNLIIMQNVRLRMKLKGFLVVNAFLNSNKFNEIYDWLKKAAYKRDIDLDVFNNGEIIPEGYDFGLFWDKDIPLAKSLEKRGIRLFNSAEAIRICDDKYVTYDILSDSEIAMPLTKAVPMTYENIGFTNFDFVDGLMSDFEYPVVIKECHGSFGAQVYLADNRDAACRVLSEIGGRPAIFQEYIAECSGNDIRINMVGNKAVCAMERYNDHDFRANVTNGGSMRPHEVTGDELELALRVMEKLGLDFAGVDILLSDKGPLLCEVNSNAHFKNIFDCTGVNVADCIMDYIIEELKK